MLMHFEVVGGVEKFAWRCVYCNTIDFLHQFVDGIIIVYF